jgi:TIR domain/SIR2-like domain
MQSSDIAPSPLPAELAPVRPWTEEDWRSLLRRIADERVGVIPILGPDLVEIATEAGPIPLTLFLARELATRLSVQLPALGDPTPFDTVAAEHSVGGGKRTSFTEELCELTSQLALPIPKPLRQLAEIEQFALFVTTAFDPLLIRALTEARGHVPQTLPYAKSEKPDLGAELPALRSARECVVCQILGEPTNSAGQWAITEEDRLEFHHALQAPTRQPHLLFSELQTRHLLLLGGGHPDWLARFFLRNIRGNILSLARPVEEFVVDSAVLSDASLRRFLSRYSPQTRLHPTGDARAFIDELHQRFLEKYPRRIAAAVLPTNFRPPAAKPPPRAVFLSYAREDLTATRLLYAALCEAGVPAWFDIERLETGDDYQRKIFSSIDDATLFIPVVSHAASDKRPRFFRLEWAHAAARISLFPPGQPVFIDDLLEAEAPVDDKFLKCHIVRLTFSRESGEFVDAAAVREWAATVRGKMEQVC